MSTHYLPVFRNNATLELQERLPNLVSRAGSLREILEFCRQFRIRAISSLFLEGFADAMIADLCRSGRAYSALIKTSPELEIVSKGTPFFDAVASADWDTAAAIAAASSVTWNPEEEFEDDYLYYVFLFQHFFLNAPAAECQDTLTRYEQVLDGADDPRFRSCQAFIDGDEIAFEDAILDVLDHHQSHYRRLVEVDAIVPEQAATEGRLCVEGLALVRLAQRKAFALLEDYPLVPSLTRQDVSLDLALIDWKTL